MGKSVSPVSKLKFWKRSKFVLWSIFLLNVFLPCSLTKKSVGLCERIVWIMRISAQGHHKSRVVKHQKSDFRSRCIIWPLCICFKARFATSRILGHQIGTDQTNHTKAAMYEAEQPYQNHTETALFKCPENILFAKRALKYTDTAQMVLRDLKSDFFGVYNPTFMVSLRWDTHDSGNSLADPKRFSCPRTRKKNFNQKYCLT